MKGLKTIITRADDCASSRSANRAILKSVESGFIKNVSIMGNCSYLEEAAELLAHRKDVCFGMHAVLNSEWKHFKWGPVLPVQQVISLVDQDGYFYDHPVALWKNSPDIDEILKEYEAQLDRITRAGFMVSYVDSHMVPERYNSNMRKRMDDWIESKGLLNHHHYYCCIPENDSLSRHPEEFNKVLEKLPIGQYFLLFHPSIMSEESLLMGNEQVSGYQVAFSRSCDMDFCSSEATMESMVKYGFISIRYDEAVRIEGI